MLSLPLAVSAFVIGLIIVLSALVVEYAMNKLEDKALLDFVIEPMEQCLQCDAMHNTGNAMCSEQCLMDAMKYSFNEDKDEALEFDAWFNTNIRDEAVKWARDEDHEVALEMHDEISAVIALERKEA